MKAVVKVPLDFAIKGVVSILQETKRGLEELSEKVGMLPEGAILHCLDEAETRIEDVCKILEVMLKEESGDGDEDGE